MQPQIIHAKLEKHPVFQKFRQEHPQSYLTHFFIMYNNDVIDSIFVGYYQPDKDLIASFVIEKDSVMLNPGDAVFKQEETAVKKLELDKVVVDFPVVITSSKAVLQKHYNYTGSFMKVIMILQVLHDVPTYNITFLTSNFKTINVRTDASTGKLLSHSEQNLLNMGK